MSSFEVRLSDFMRQHKLLTSAKRGDGILVAVSGGIDSMVLATALSNLKLCSAIAHVNFRLRGDASDADATLVKQWAKKRRLPYFEFSADTKAYAKKHGLSVQVAAREIRYRWLEKTATEQGIPQIATGHHLEDSIETFFIHLLRGTGIHGLGGIPARNGNIIRPMLFAERKEIETYATTQQIPFREDGSNAGDDYLRNRIRHHLLPVLKELHPTFLKTMSGNLERFHFAISRYNERMKQLNQMLVERKQGDLMLSLSALLEFEQPEALLYALLAMEGVRVEEPEKMLVQDRPGKTFHADGKTIIRDRNKLILTDSFQHDDSPKEVLKSTSTLRLSGGIVKIKTMKYRPGMEYETAKGELLLDSEALRFPLSIRRWKAGDRFQPLGMKRPKKVSDFLTDLKLSLAEKQATWLLVDHDDILCILGVRISDTCKVHAGTKKAVRITWTNERHA